MDLAPAWHRPGTNLLHPNFCSGMMGMTVPIGRLIIAPFGRKSNGTARRSNITMLERTP
jgi:hypothetical protein